MNPYSFMPSHWYSWVSYTVIALLVFAWALSMVIQLCIWLHKFLTWAETTLSRAITAATNETPVAVLFCFGVVSVVRAVLFVMNKAHAWLVKGETSTAAEMTGNYEPMGGAAMAAMHEALEQQEDAQWVSPPLDIIFMSRYAQQLVANHIGTTRETVEWALVYLATGAGTPDAATAGLVTAADALRTIHHIFCTLHRDPSWRGRNHAASDEAVVNILRHSSMQRFNARVTQILYCPNCMREIHSATTILGNQYMCVCKYQGNNTLTVSKPATRDPVAWKLNRVCKED